MVFSLILLVTFSFKSKSDIQPPTYSVLKLSAGLASAAFAE
jgi:hypothetical protein